MRKKILKLIIIYFSLFLLLACKNPTASESKSILNPQYIPPSNPEGIIGLNQWLLDPLKTQNDNLEDYRTLTDHSGNSNHGVLKNSNAVTFNGTSNIIDLGNHSDLLPTDITYQAWVRVPALSNWAGILTTIPSWGTGFGLQIGMNQNIAAMISGAYLRTTWAPSINTWYHIVATHDSGTNANILYVNGAVERTTTRAVTYHGSAKLVVGAFYTSPSLRFTGQLADVRVYNYARTPAQIMEDYLGGFSGAEPVVSLPMTEGDGVLVHDTSGNSRHGTIVGGSAPVLWTDTQDLFHWNFLRGFRLNGSTNIPALASGAMAADGNPITNPAGAHHNCSETTIEIYGAIDWSCGDLLVNPQFLSNTPSTKNNNFLNYDSILSGKDLDWLLNFLN